MDQRKLTALFTLLPLLAAVGVVPLAAAQGNDTAVTEEGPGLLGYDTETVQAENIITFTVSTGQIPEGPIIVVPPANDSDTGEVILPANETQTENVTIIDTEGNITEIPDGNVTQIDNSTTVVVAPEPPCGCPEQPAGGDTGLPPVTVSPAAGQEVIIVNGTVTTTNETGVVVEGSENATTPAPVEPEPEPKPEAPAAEPAEPEPAPAPTTEVPANDTGAVGGGGLEPAPSGNDTRAAETNLTGGNESLVVQAMNWIPGLTSN